MMNALKTMLLVMAVASPVAQAAEEYQPLHPGARAVSETAGVRVGPLRRMSSADPQSAHRMQRAPLHKNMVTLQLPALGAQPESRQRIVDVSGLGPDGTLDFAPVRPIDSLEMINGPEIPGLIVPEILAEDQRGMPALQPLDSAEAFKPEPLYFPSSIPLEGEEDPEALRMLEPAPWPEPIAGADAGEPELRRLDSLAVAGGEGAALSRIELPSPAQDMPGRAALTPLAPVAAMSGPEIPASPAGGLRPPVAAGSLRPPAAPETPAVRTSLAQVPPLEPAQLPDARPVAAPRAGAAFKITVPAPGGDGQVAVVARESRQPAPAPMAETAYVQPQPEVWLENIPGSGAVYEEEYHEPAQYAAPSRARRVAPRARRSGAAPVRELKNILDPIYRQGGR